MSNPNKTEFSLRCGISVYKWNLHLHSTIYAYTFVTVHALHTEVSDTDS